MQESHPTIEASESRLASISLAADAQSTPTPIREILEDINLCLYEKLRLIEALFAHDHDEAAPTASGWRTSATNRPAVATEGA
jgi:hypothetical protein